MHVLFSHAARPAPGGERAKNSNGTLMSQNHTSVSLMNLKVQETSARSLRGLLA